MDYWDSHGHELQMLMTNYASAGAGDMADSYTPEGSMIKENDRKDPETTKIMLRYKEFINKATMMEPPVELGDESAAKKVDTKEPKDPKAEQGDEKIKTQDPKHSPTGFSMTKPFEINNTLRSQKVRYALGESYEAAEGYLTKAEKAKADGDMFSHHMHMADHHDALAQWHDSKGRSGSSDIHMKKAEAHEAKAHALKEDVYTSDTKQKDYQTKDKDGNWVWRKRKIHPKRITFDASKMGAVPAQLNPVDEEVETLDEISSKLAGNYYGAATKKHLDKVGMKPNMYDRIEKDMGKKRKEGLDRALDRVTGARKTNEDKVPAFESWVLKQKSMISKKDDKKKVKGKSEIKDNATMDPKNSGGTPPFDPFFSGNK
jgi:hypothetical protein